MRFGGLAIGREYEFYEQPVLLEHAELMAVLTRHIPVARKLPGLVRIFHQMTAIAKLRVLLDVVIISHGKDDPQNRNDEHKGHDNGLFFRGETLFKLIEYF
jgi:hypothetical protein